jgi:hypothetical protein
MSTLDPIAYSLAQIKAKASAAQKAKSKVTLKSSTLVIPKLPTGPRPDSVICKRANYLKSINAAEIKTAAKSLGIDVSFGLDAKNWLEKNPQAKEKMSDIMALVDKMLKSKNATVQAASISNPDLA